MTVKEVATEVVTLMQMSELTSELNRSESEALRNRDVATLVKCINNAACEIAADGFPIVVTEELAALNGVIPLASFSRKPTAVKSVRGKTGAVKFEFGQDGVSVSKNGQLTVTYWAQPKEAKLNSQVDVSPLCDGTMLVYMSARGFCLSTGRTDEASIWDQLYDAYAEKKRLLRRASLPCREWR